MASRRAKIGITIIVLGILFPVGGFFTLGIILSNLNQSMPVPFVELCCTSMFLIILGLGIYLTDND